MSKINFTGKISVLKNTNRIIGGSGIDLSSIRPGSLIKVYGDNVLYTIANTKSIFLIKDFEAIDVNHISIDSINEIMFFRGDSVAISYKEYELFTIENIIEKGHGYKINDKIFLQGGTASVDIKTNLTELTSVTVNQVDDDGGILEIGLHKRGIYIEPPPAETFAVGGKGKNAKFACVYKIVDDRKIVERTIMGVEYHPTKTIFYLNASLPIGIKNGKMSCNKWEIELLNNYIGESKIAVDYEIAQDFTNYLNLPYVLRGSRNAEMLINKSLTILDSKIKAIDEKLAELDKKNTEVPGVNNRLETSANLNLLSTES